MGKFTLKLALTATAFGLIAFSAMAIKPQVDSVATVIGISRTTAYSGSFVTTSAIGITNPDSVKERGVCINITGNPVITDTKFPAYKSIPNVAYEPAALTGLTANTRYYIKAYATNFGGETSYSTQKEFKTANDVESIWTLNSDTLSAVSGSITASNLSWYKMTTALSFNQNSGGNGATTVLLLAPTGLLKFTGTQKTIVAFDLNVYMPFSITSTSTKNISVNQLLLTILGYKTGSIKMKVDYSFDDFATAGTTLSNFTYNDATKTNGSNGEISLTSANPAITTSMGKENILWPTNVVLKPGATIYFRLYLWNKAGGTPLMKNLIVSGVTDTGTGINRVSSASCQLNFISTNNELKIENADNIHQLDILSVNGKILHSCKNSKSEIQLSTNDLQSGVYIVRAYTENGLQTGKFVK